jgi:hypothetical protein
MATHMSSLETEPKSYRRRLQMFARRFAMTAIANLESRWAFVTKPPTLDLPAGVTDIQCAFVVPVPTRTRLVPGERRQTLPQYGSAPTVLNSKRNKPWLPKL